MKSFNIDRNMKDKAYIRLAITKVCKNKKKRNGRPTKKYRQARKILANIEEYIDLTYEIVSNGKEARSNPARNVPSGRISAGVHAEDFGFFFPPLRKREGSEYNKCSGISRSGYTPTCRPCR